jgi:hypothetical protein
MTKVYKIDPDDRLLLEEVLNIAQQTIEIQYDDATADSMQEILAIVAERFGISSTPLDNADKKTDYLTLVKGGLDE